MFYEHLNNEKKLQQMEIKTNPCPEFPFFGATYPDARCIDGYLWDLDSNEGEFLTKGGEDACPFCRTEEFIEDRIDDENGITREKLLDYVEKLKTKHK